MGQGKWTMHRAILVFGIGSVLAALLMQTFLFQQSLSRQIRTESISDNETALAKMQTDLTSFIHNLRTEMLTIYNEREMIDSLREKAKSGESDTLKDWYWQAWYLGRKRFGNDDQLLAMYLYDVDDQIVSAYRYNCTTFSRNIYDAQYDANAERVKEYVHGEDSGLFISGYYNPLEKKDVVRFVLKLHNYDEDREPIGYLVCEINSAALTSIMSKYVDSSVCLWLQPVDDQIVAATGDTDANQLRIRRQLAKIVENYYDTSTLEEEYENYYLIQVGQNEYNLEAFALVSRSLLTTAQRSLTRSLLVIMGLMIAVIVGFVFFLSKWMTRPVEQMQETIARIKNGETQLRVQPVGWSEELEVLGTEFNDMLDRVQTMAQDEYKYKLLVKQTEYKMLQAQINPHFLYNTLNTMSGIANAQNCTLVSSLCYSLSAVFRYSLNMTDELSTVEKELDHVRNYLYVMDVRNGSSISYEYEIDSDTLSDRLPRICLQPIVENAILHGLRNVRRKDKKLLIRTEHNGENLVATVQDNGVGMDADAMNAQLQKNDPKRVESGVSIGILNVNARLKTLFGVQYGIFIESSAGDGTTVRLVVPASREDTEGDNGKA